MTLGFKDFVAGDVLTAAQVDGYLMRQTVMVFATDAARDSALSGNLEEGMHCYTEDNNRRYFYTGAAWEIIDEPAQTWTPTITQNSGAVTKTVNRSGYQRSRGSFKAWAVMTTTAGASGMGEITISTPVTLANAADAHGFVIWQSGSDHVKGLVYPSSTTVIKFTDTNSVASTFVGDSTAIVNGDVFRLHLWGTY